MSIKARQNEIVKLFDDETILFRTDQPHEHQTDREILSAEALVTLDFGVGFEAVRVFWQAWDLPHINSEFYSGWLDHWRQSHHTMNANDVVLALALEDMLRYAASVNFDMFIGRTAFGFYQLAIMLYGYDMPLSEADDMTWKYQTIRELMKKFRSDPLRTREVKTRQREHMEKLLSQMIHPLHDQERTLTIIPSMTSYDRD
jgi:beta-galactosidase